MKKPVLPVMAQGKSGVLQIGHGPELKEYKESKVRVQGVGRSLRRTVFKTEPKELRSLRRTIIEKAP
jgi:hypothetical protein